MVYVPPAAPPFPETSKEFFIYKPKGSTWDGEDHADGFVMEFRVTGEEFKIGIDLPREAAHGPYMIIFYASFYHDDHSGSVVETGLSFSGKKGWNFTADLAGKSHDHTFLGDLTKKPQLELVVSFKPDHHGGLVESSLNGLRSSVRVHRHKSINKMRLVIATGDRRGAHFSEAGMTLKSVDNKLPRVSGVAKWQRGHKITDGDHQSVLKSATPFGMRCSLPPEKKPVAAHHHK